MDRIYLDASGGTKMYNSSKVELIKYLDVTNSSHDDDLTKQAKVKYKKLLQFIVQISVLNKNKQKEYESIITGGGSESNNLIIKAIVCSVNCQTKIIPHIIIASYEHKSIIKCVEQLLQESKIELTKVNPRQDGKIYAEDICSQIKKNTSLISVMSVNNETGISNIEELKKIGKYIKQQKFKIYFHSDNVQSFCKYKCYMDDLGLDLISCSFYKIYAPGKIGAIVINSKKMKNIIQSFPLINGTLLESQNNHGGTLPLSLCSASLNSLNITNTNRENKNKRLQFLKLYFLKEMSDRFKIVEYFPKVEQIIEQQSPKWILVNFSPIDTSVSHIIFFTLIRGVKKNNKYILDGVCGQKIKNYLFSKNIIVSNGSNCGDPQDSYVLKSQNVPNKLQQGVVRVSLSDTTIRYELKTIAQQLEYYIKNVYDDVLKKK